MELYSTVGAVRARLNQNLRRKSSAWPPWPRWAPARASACATELQDLDARQVHPRPPCLVVDDAELDALAAGAAGHDPGRIDEHHPGRDRRPSAAAGTGGHRRGRLEGEHLPQRSPERVAIQGGCRCHTPPPVGPNRSVFTRPGGWPSRTRLVATASTNGVGPQTKAEPLPESGQLTSASIWVSTRRR